VVKARKRFGQHFLESAWVTKLVAALDPLPQDRFIEIGPGHGAITAPLASRVERLAAIEVDRDLAAALAARPWPNVTVTEADVLHIDLLAVARALGPPVRVVGNLPYNISSPILFRLLSASTSGLLQDATLMLQKEVADRLVAAVGTAEYGVLTVTTGLWADVTTLLELPPGAFRPAPKVRSAVVRLAFRPPPADVVDAGQVVTIVRAVFTQRRKTMANALAPLLQASGIHAGDLLREAGIDPMRRPQTLALADFARIGALLAARNARK